MPPPATVAICVPARDEARTLPALLAAVAEQDAPLAELTLCIHLDGCADGSRALLDGVGPRLPFALRVGHGARADRPNAGAARAAAMALGRAAVGERAGAVLLSTDADSRPRRGWVGAALRALAEADVAAGRIVRADEGEALQDRLEAYLDRLHRHRRRLDPVPWEAARSCHFSAGANLAFRAAAYAALGGFAPLPHGEDATLLDDAGRAGLRVRRDADMAVETSSRRDGRAAGGLAAMLRALDAGLMPRVAHPADAAWQYRAHAAARRAFARIDEPAVRGRLGATLGLAGDHVLGVGRECPNAEAFAMRVVPAAPAASPLVPLPEAEAALALLERAAEPLPA